MKTDQPRKYIPALKYSSFTRFYDKVVRITTREKTFKMELLKQSGLQSGQHVLDVGCGTGTLTQMIATSVPDLWITGLDADSAALEQAQSKLAPFGDRVCLQQGYAQQLPFNTNYFDIAVSSLFFHHLTTEQKLDALKEILRVLKPGGRLHIADWGRPASLSQRLLFFAVQLLDGFETTQDSVEHALPKLIEDAGFKNFESKGHFKTRVGTIRLFQALKL